MLSDVVELRLRIPFELCEHRSRSAYLWLEDVCLTEACGDSSGHFVPTTQALPVTNALDRTPRYLPKRQGDLVRKNRNLSFPLRPSPCLRATEERDPMRSPAELTNERRAAVVIYGLD